MRRRQLMRRQQAVPIQKILLTQKRLRLRSITRRHRRRKHRLMITAIPVTHRQQPMQHTRDTLKHRQQQTRQLPREMSRQYMILQRQLRKHTRHI